MKLVLVAGLPGSGKTYYAQQRAKAEGLFLVDDPRPETGGLTRALQEFKGSDYLGVIVTDPWFCLPNTRKSAEHVLSGMLQPTSIEWVFFVNNPSVCLANISQRESEGDSRDVSKTFSLLRSAYAIPSGVQALPVWTSED